jgi:hypothetical protein
MSTKRSRAITLATAGTLALATAISLAATLPAASSPAAASADAAYTSTTSQQATARPSANGVAQAVMFARMRSIEAARHQQELAAQKAAKAAEAKASAAKAAAAKVAAAKSSARAVAARHAAAQAAKKAQPAQQAAAITPSGSPEQVAERLLSQFGWSSSQFSCLQPLWEHESGWSVTAENPSSGAYGIPQALPAAQMASAGADWQANAATQIRWGLTYIQGRYGSPCGAWAHEEADNWY